MSLVTRCPACSTTFKVVRDQLRISEGWVRCGRCSHVFDATIDLHEASDAAPAAAAGSPTPLSSSVRAIDDDGADLLDDDPEPAVVAVPSASISSVSSSAAGQPPEAPPPMPAHGLVADEPWTDLDEARESEWKPPPSPLPPFPNIDLNLGALPQPPRISMPRPFASASDEDRDESDERSGNDEGEEASGRSDSDQAQIEKVLRRARIKSARLAGAPARVREQQVPPAATPASLVVVRAASEPDGAFPVVAAFDDESEAVEPFSSGDARRGGAEFWRRPAVRRGLPVLVAAAALLLVVQVLRHERDSIVARQPGLRPALSALCKATGCELSALHRIGDIVVVGAAFAREKSGGNDYQLSFTLRNGAPVPLAMPAVEVSLLDTREQAVVRRVLMPADFGAPAVLPARTERSVLVPLALSEAGTSSALPPIVGYGVEPFYP